MTAARRGDRAPTPPLRQGCAPCPGRTLEGRVVDEAVTRTGGGAVWGAGGSVRRPPQCARARASVVNREPDARARVPPPAGPCLLRPFAPLPTRREPSLAASWNALPYAFLVRPVLVLQHSP